MNETTYSAPGLSVLQPTAAQERITTLDVVRGFALLGILLMNILAFGLPETLFPKLFTLPRNSVDFWTLTVILVFFDGTMRALFSMLFGAGVLLFTAKKEDLTSGYTVADFYYRRLLWLVAFGLLNSYILLWRGDILYTYGLCRLLLFPFRKLGAKPLLMIAALFLAILAAKDEVRRREMIKTRADYLTAVKLEKQKKKLSEEQQKAKEAWLEIEKNTKIYPKKNAEIIKKMRSDYPTVFSKLVPVNSRFQSTQFYQYLIWDVIGMMFLGMALYKLGFFSNQLSRRTYLLTLLVGYGLGITLGWLAFENQLAWFKNPGAVADRVPFSFRLFYHVRRACTALGHTSVLLLVLRLGIVPWLMQALAKVGQMAFTNYLLQTVLCTLIFYGYGLGYFGKLALHELYYVVGGIWVFQLVYSVIWLSYFRFGPLEWAWRSLTYWKKQPLRVEKENLSVA